MYKTEYNKHKDNYPKKYKEQAINNIVPIIGSVPKPKNTQYQTFDLKAAQAAYAQALG